MIVSVHSDIPKAAVRHLMIPIKNPPITAPGKLPIPPITAATNGYSPIVTEPNSKLKLSPSNK